MKRLFAGFLILVLAGTASDNAGTLEGWSQFRLGGLGVMLPSKNGWTAQKEVRGLKTVRIERSADSAPKVVHYILVAEQFYSEKLADWTAPEIAMDYREWEVASMKELGVDTGQYKLEELKLGKELRSGHTYYYLKNAKVAVDPTKTGWSFERQNLYLLFLPDHAKKREFYKIFIGALCVSPACTRDDLSLDSSLKILDHLEIGADTSKVERLILDGKYEAALDAVRELQRKHPDDLDLKDLETKIYYDLGLAAKKAGKEEEALSNYTRAIELSHHHHAAALNNRAFILASRGQVGAALADIDEALSAAPKSSLYHANRCLFLRLKGELDRALEECDTAVSLGPPTNRENRSWVFIQRGLVRRMLGNVDGAVEDLVASLHTAKPETVKRIQALMKAAALYEGPVDGLPSPDLQVAIGTCIRSDSCFAQASRKMSDIVEFVP